MCHLTSLLLFLLFPALPALAPPCCCCCCCFGWPGGHVSTLPGERSGARGLARDRRRLRGLSCCLRRCHSCRCRSCRWGRRAGEQALLRWLLRALDDGEHDGARARIARLSPRARPALPPRQRRGWPRRGRATGRPPAARLLQPREEGESDAEDKDDEDGDDDGDDADDGDDDEDERGRGGSRGRGGASSGGGRAVAARKQKRKQKRKQRKRPGSATDRSCRPTPAWASRSRSSGGTSSCASSSGPRRRARSRSLRSRRERAGSNSSAAARRAWGINLDLIPSFLTQKEETNDSVLAFRKHAGNVN